MWMKLLHSINNVDPLPLQPVLIQSDANVLLHTLPNVIQLYDDKLSGWLDMATRAGVDTPSSLRLSGDW